MTAFFIALLRDKYSYEDTPRFIPFLDRNNANFPINRSHLSISIQYFPPVSVQYFPLFPLTENDFCAA